MPITVDVEVRGLKEAQAKVEQVVTDMHGAPILQAFRDGTILVTRDAKMLAPSDRGQLRASITPEVRLDGQDVLGVVGSNKEYAAAQELGTRPFWPPPGSMEVWAQRHPPWTDWTIRKHISEYGVKAKYYLQRGFNWNRTRVIALIERAVEKIVEK